MADLIVTERANVTEVADAVRNIANSSDTMTLRQMAEAINNHANAVTWAEQELTEEQQAQARTNIGAASVEAVTQLSEDKVNKPASGNGTAGQFLTSDGAGGTAWVSLPMYNGEVEDA